MPKVKNVEKKIWSIEDFDVKFLHGGKDIHGAKEGIPRYPFTNRAKNDMTVTEWKKSRFSPYYPGYEVTVLDGDGNDVAGQTKLSTVRDTYIEEES